MLSFVSTVPLLILWGCYALVLFTVIIASWLKVQSAKLHSRMGRFISVLKLGGEMDRTVRHRGLALIKIEELRAACKDLKNPPEEWWEHVDGSIEAYTSPEEQEGWFITERPRSILSYDGTVGRHLHTAFFASFPGLLTG